VRDLVGKDEEALALAPEVKTIGDFARWLEENRPPLAGRLGAVRFARNEEFATSSDAIADGDVIALIPPVAGG
jgi:molybdopterin converting factor subunit 1